MNPLTSVITLTCNRLEYTRRCLPSLLATDKHPWELVVVDNGSRDGSVEWLEEFARRARASGVPVSLVLNADNVGCCTARNQGVERASGRRLVFVDNDVALRSRGWLTRLGERLESDPAIGMVGPKLVFPFRPYDIQFAGGAVSRSGRVQFMGRGEPRDEPRFNAPRDVQCFVSACCMFKRSVADEIGLLDEAFNPVQYEDIDYSYRMRSRGYRIVYLPTVEMYHFENVTTDGGPAGRNTHRIIRNGLRFKRRWRRMFENEEGPADAETVWRRIDKRLFAEVGDLEVIA
jgi:GT2 family glycosyltransferase